MFMCWKEAGEVMNCWLYTELIEDYFPKWLKGCSYLVQDFERCLHSEEPLSSLSGLGVELVEDYPKCSQDFNAIENAWELLRDRPTSPRPSARHPSPPQKHQTTYALDECFVFSPSPNKR